MPTVGTSAIMVITARDDDPISFELHADADNTDTILYSTADPSVGIDNSSELLAGASVTFSNFTGALWILGEATGLKWSISGVQHASQTREPSEVLRS